MKILIVKLGAMGDVLRTTPLLTAYRRAFPEAKITWVVDRAHAGVLRTNHLINELVEYSPEALTWLETQNYDIAINLDKEPEALNALAAAKADSYKGFGWNSDCTDLMPMNSASEYAVKLGIDDELKFRQNKKTYQQISYEQAELPFEMDEYIFKVSHHEIQYARQHLLTLGLDENDWGKWIGLNTGSGERFAGKKIPEHTLLNLAEKLNLELGRKVLFLGGPEEKERNIELQKKAQVFAVNAGTHHTIQQFAGLVSQAGVVLTGDTIAMHIAIATKVPTLVYFGSTCAPEIELYGRGNKIVSSHDCAPCYKSNCPLEGEQYEQCMADITVDQLFDGTAKILNTYAQKDSLS